VNFVGHQDSTVGARQQARQQAEPPCPERSLEIETPDQAVLGYAERQLDERLIEERAEGPDQGTFGRAGPTGDQHALEAGIDRQQEQGLFGLFEPRQCRER
jgi:hypothetical protein